jgi:hypothetical protein
LCRRGFGPNASGLLAGLGSLGFGGRAVFLVRKVTSEALKSCGYVLAPAREGEGVRVGWPLPLDLAQPPESGLEVWIQRFA